MADTLDSYPSQTDNECTDLIVRPAEGEPATTPRSSHSGEEQSTPMDTDIFGGFGTPEEEKETFTGLNNQGATCYMNSLLQTLFMTPEFREALYQYRNPKDTPLENCIPYHLQRLFVKLQVTKKRSVETKTLTKSFGWSDVDAFEQHDVQELCRKLFESLEAGLKGTDHEKFLSDLFEGKMKDYVHCRNCNNESSRSDTFMDIPLAIRAFGQPKPIKSMEEGMKNFVKEEILDGNNQYECEKCKGKQDAIKGLKFLTFPKILMVQLKRFDFDIELMRRVKLDSEVSFPFETDLTDFVEEKDRRYCYELYSVLVHSGSSFFGHYYAYIKDITTGQWYCFNDSSVQKVTEKEVKKAFGTKQASRFSFGGGSSSNAYMLVYRRIEEVEEEIVMPDVPEDVLQEVIAEEELEKKEKGMMKLKFYWENDVVEMKFNSDFCPAEVMTECLEAVGLQEKVNPENARMRVYMPTSRIWAQPLESDTPLKRSRLYDGSAFTLEIKDPDEEFLPYRYEDETVNVLAGRSGDDFRERKMKHVDIPRLMIVGDFKAKIRKVFRIPEDPETRVFMKNTYSSKSDDYKESSKELVDDAAELRRDHFVRDGDVFAVAIGDSAVEAAQHVLDDMRNEITVTVVKEDEGESEFRLTLNKRMKLAELRQLIADRLSMDPNCFVLEKGTLSYRKELSGSDETLGSLSFYSDSRIWVKEGTPLKSGEERLELVYHNPLTKELTDCFDVVLHEHTPVRQLKEQIKEEWMKEKHKELRQKLKLEPFPEHIRLRDTYTSSVGTILVDDTTLHEGLYSTYSAKRIAFEGLDAEEKKKKMRGEVVITLVYFSPEKMSIEKRKEIVVSKSMLLSEFKQKVADTLEMDPEFVSLAQESHSGEDHVIEIAELPWDAKKVYNLTHTNPPLCDHFYLRDSDIIYVKDKREKDKKLSETEIKEIVERAKKKKRPSARFSGYGYGKERELKIYTAPSKSVTEKSPTSSSRDESTKTLTGQVVDL